MYNILDKLYKNLDKYGGISSFLTKTHMGGMKSEKNEEKLFT